MGAGRGKPLGVPITNIDLQAAASYVQGRQTPQGGFCYYRGWGVEEPNAADTFHAAASLALLDVPPADSGAAVAWAQALQDPSGAYPDIATAWHAVEALERLGARPLHDPSPWLTGRLGFLFTDPAAGGDAGALLLEAARSLELCRRFGVTLEPRYGEAAARLLRAVQDAGGAFPRGAPSLEACAMALRIALAAGMVPDRRVLDYARACEDPVYGFRALPSGRSTHLGVLMSGARILRTFDLAVRYEEALRRTVAACQQPAGGFSRQLGAVVTLTDTWLALATLHLLERSEQSHPVSGSP